MITKQAITTLAFDLDGTLTPGKSPVPPAMLARITELLETYVICVISGESFAQFEIQLLDGLAADVDRLKNLHLMPTCGTRYYRYDDGWSRVYAEDFTAAEKTRIMNVLESAVDSLGLREPETYGPTIEDRGSQITFSALGQEIVARLGEEGVRRKESWDPDRSKKNALAARVSSELPEFEVRVGGDTSVDITRPGVDKAYGMRRFMEMTGTGTQEIVFFGDRLDDGGNDYPVRGTGVGTEAVKGWQDTFKKLKKY